MVFDQQVTFRVRSHQREEFTKLLGMRIYLTAQASSTCLNIELTEEGDPLFLY